VVRLRTRRERSMATRSARSKGGGRARGRTRSRTASPWRAQLLHGTNGLEESVLGVEGRRDQVEVEEGAPALGEGERVPERGFRAGREPSGDRAGNKATDWGRGVGPTKIGSGGWILVP
jgi:hypothetical protein